MQEFNIGVGINYYDDPHGLMRILNDDTVYDYIHTFYVINGRYHNRMDLPEHDPEYIYDIKKLYRKVHLVDMHDAIQIDKRNRYWELAEYNKHDFFIVCDSDEYMKINPETLNNTLHIVNQRPEKCYPIKQYYDGITTMSRPRLFKKDFTFRHRLNTTNGISHGSLYEDYGKSNVEVINQMYAWFKDHEKRDKYGNQTGIPGIDMWHDKEYRSQSRVIADRIYYNDNSDR